MKNGTDLPTLLTLGQIGATGGVLANQHQLIALLAYVAHEGPADRLTVARLFWPHSQTALNSLSSALTRIRRVLPEAVEADRHTISTTCRTDAHELLRALADGRHDAYRYHAGMFLARFHIKSIGIELEEWIFDMRETLADAAVSNAIAEVRRLDAAGDVQGAADVAEWAIDTAISPAPLVPEAGWLHQVLQRAQSPAAYRLLLMVRDVGDADGPSVVSAPVVSAGVAPAGPLHGRSADLSRIDEAFGAHRIVNVFGIGGVGKSRLASAFVASAARSTRSRFVAITRPDEGDGGRLWSAIADEVFPGAPQTPSAAADRLDEECFLLIDSVAATPSIAHVLTELAGVDGLQLLIVSRQRLTGPGLHSISVRGLALDDDGSIGPAVRLFRDRAGPDLVARIGEEEFDGHARALCQSVSGLPLAIELISGWLRVVPIHEIAGILADEILDATPPGIETSPTLVIERTWDMLPEVLRTSLTTMAVFGASFDRAAALQVADVGLQELSDLHDYSLIDIEDDGRLRCQSLVRAFAERRLANRPDDLRAARDRHRNVYLPILIDDDATEETFRLEQPNIVAAWFDCLDTGDERARVALNGIHRLALRSGQILAAKSLYEASLARLGAPESLTQRSLAAAVVANLAWVNMLLGNADETEALCEKGLGWLSPDDVRTHVRLLRTRCALAGNDGDAATALAGYEEARGLVVDLDDARLQALLDEDMGRSRAMLGDHDLAIAAFRRTLDAGRSLGDPHMEARSLLLLGGSYTASEPERAFVLFDEGERIARENSLRRLEAYFPVDRAYAQLFHGLHHDAVAEFTKGVAISTENGDQVLLVRCQLGLARALLRSGTIDAGLVELRTGLRAAVLAELWHPPLGAALDIVDLARRSGPDTDRLRGVHHFALNHRKAPEADRRRFGGGVAIAEYQFTEPERVDELCEVVQAIAESLIVSG